MSSAQDHYREAESLLASIGGFGDLTSPIVQAKVAIAQVHATLATAPMAVEYVGVESRPSPGVRSVETVIAPLYCEGVNHG